MNSFILKEQYTPASSEWHEEFDCYVITDGKTAIYAKDDNEDEGQVKMLLAVLNAYSGDIWLDNSHQIIIDYQKEQIDAMTAALAAKDAEIERLKDTLHIDQTGLAKGLAAVNKLVESYWWVTEGRGPYTWNDNKYKDEMRNMLESVRDAATNALSSSGAIAHTVCCGKEPRTVTVEDIGYVKREQADKEIERLKQLCVQLWDSEVGNNPHVKKHCEPEFIAKQRAIFIKENNL